jgi:hypothetical protein
MVSGSRPARHTAAWSWFWFEIGGMLTISHALAAMEEAHRLADWDAARSAHRVGPWCGGVDTAAHRAVPWLMASRLLSLISW